MAICNDQIGHYNMRNKKNISLAQERVQVWIGNLNTDKSQTKEYSKFLSQDEIGRAERFKFSVDRDRFIKGRYLLRKISSDYLDVAPENIKFDYNAFGKPSLHDFPELYFNLSHSRNIIIFVFTVLSEIGVDIEYIQNDLDHLDIGKTVFSKSELHQLREESDFLKPGKFYEYWTRKEAFIKATGFGLSLPIDLKLVSVIRDEVEFDHKVKPTGIARDPQWIIQSFTPQEKYKAAIVLRSLPMKITYSTLDE